MLVLSGKGSIILHHSPQLVRANTKERNFRGDLLYCIRVRFDVADRLT